MPSLSPEKLAELMHDHGGSLLLYARQICVSAEDVVQEAFIELMHQQSVPDRPVAWLFKVVRNRALNERRSAMRRRGYEKVGAVFQSAESVDASWEQIQNSQEVADELAQLSGQLREIVIAKIWGQLTLQEIADNMQLSVATTFRRYREALEVLRCRLQTPLDNSLSSPSQQGNNE